MIRASKKILKGILNGSLDLGSPIGKIQSIELYSGAQPDHKYHIEPTGTLLVLCCRDDRYKAFIGEGLNPGTAGWFRAYFKETNMYIDGSVGTAGADLCLLHTGIEQGEIIAFRSGFEQELSLRLELLCG